MPQLAQIPITQLQPIVNPNLLNSFSTFNDDYTWTIANGTGTAIQKTQSKRTGPRGLQLKSLGSDGIVATSTLTEITITETGRYIVSLKIREDAGGLTANKFSLNLYVNGLLQELSFILSGEITDWKCITQIVNLEAGDTLSYNFGITSSSSTDYYIVSVDDLKLEFDNLGNGIPSLYDEPIATGLYLVKVENSVKTYEPYIVQEVSQVIDVPSIASNGYSEVTATLVGAEIGNFVQMTYPSEIITLGLIVGYPIVTATDTVKFLIHNHSGGSINPSSGTYTFKIIK